MADNTHKVVKLGVSGSPHLLLLMGRGPRCPDQWVPLQSRSCGDTREGVWHCQGSAPHCHILAAPCSHSYCCFEAPAAAGCCICTKLFAPCMQAQHFAASCPATTSGRCSTAVKGERPPTSTQTLKYKPSHCCWLLLSPAAHLWKVLYCSSKANDPRCVASTWPARWLRMPAASPSFWKGCAGPTTGAAMSR